MNFKKIAFWLAVILTSVVALIYVVVVYGPVGSGGVLSGYSAQLPILGNAPDFLLTSQDGKVFKRSELDGKTWIADFIFTRCQGQCPILTQQMVRFQRELPDLRLVSFSVDPEYDKPAILEEYAKNYSADPGRWVFLTGDRSDLNRVTDGFKLSQVDEPMFHSTSFILIDSKNRIRGFYDANDSAKTQQLIRDAKSIS